MSERRRKPTPEDIIRMRQLERILDEREQELQSLGINTPREMIRTPNSRNWEAHEYAVSLLPPEKQTTARRIQEDLWIQDDYNQSGAVDYTSGDKTELQAYRQAAEQRNAALQAILTPEEFELFQLHTMPRGTELSRNTIGMEPTDQELMAMFRVIDKYWEKTGAVHGRWRAERVPSEQIREADRQLQEDLRRVLGQDRYVDHQMATTGIGQRMNNLATRYDLPRPTIHEAFVIQNELDQIEKAINRGVAANSPQHEELQQKLQQTLGPIVFEAWQSGRNQKYNIEP